MLIRGWHNMKARTLKAAILRLLHMDSQELLDESLKIDRWIWASATKGL